MNPDRRLQPVEPRVRRSRKSQGTTDTRTAILLAAERLFAERGLEAVSLREIASAAGQRHHSAVHYHFGDRATLVHDLLEYRLATLDARRDQLLDLVRLTRSNGELESLVAAFVLPLAEIADGSTWYVRFLARFQQWDHHAEIAPLFQGNPERSARRAEQLIEDRLSGLPEWLRRLRVHHMERYIVAMLADAEGQRSQDADLGAPYDVWVADLISTAVAMLACPEPAVNPAPLI
jgi:AcrR family transcriptional regulator